MALFVTYKANRTLVSTNRLMQKNVIDFAYTKGIRLYSIPHNIILLYKLFVYENFC